MRSIVSTFYGIQKLRIEAENRARDSMFDKWKCDGEECRHVVWVGKEKDKSQGASENQAISASPNRLENQICDASQENGENHIITASQKRCENKAFHASQENGENQTDTASQPQNETQTMIASHLISETHIPSASCPKCGSGMRFYPKLSPEEIFELSEIASELGGVEKKRLPYFKREVENEDIYLNFLFHVKGVGHVLSAGLISYNIPRFKSISAVHKYFGFYPDGRRKKGEQLSYNPKAKVLLWKVCSQFIKLKPEGSFYRRMYDSFKVDEAKKPVCEKCKKNHPKSKTCTKGHIHNRTVRKLGRLFLAHFWLQWRTIEGLPVSKPYPIAVLGHTNFIEWEQDKKGSDT